MSEKVAGKESPKSPSVQESFQQETAGDLYHGEHKLKRQLKNRHIAMISIGGVIGTGLFLGTANALRHGGPVGLLLGYLAVGSITYTVMISLGEMVAFLPIPGGHIKLAERFVDPAFSFTMGWNYWYNWIIVLPAELSAASVLISLWSDINAAAWITIIMLFVLAGASVDGPIFVLNKEDKVKRANQLMLLTGQSKTVVVIIINMCGAGVYGEAEFIFASIKVITIVGLIILGIVLDLGGGPDHDRLGFRFWKHPGPFVQYNDIPGAKGRFLGWWAVMTQAAFSYIGTEIVAIAAGEAKNPRRNLPKAIRRVYIRILLFYIGGVIIIGLLVPSTDPGLKLGTGTAVSSPFVIAIQRSGIKALPSIINACLLTSAWSAGSSDLYTSSRALYGLAAAGNAPKIFLKTLPNGLPVVSLVFCSLFSTLAYMGVKSGSGKVFGWFANMTSVAGLMTWFGISLTYLRFYKGMKVQGIDRSTLPYASRLQPFAAWYAMIFCLVIAFFSGWAVFLKDNWAADVFWTNYIPLILFPILYITAKIIYWRRGQPLAWRSTEKMDFVSDLAEIEADIYDEPPPKNAWEAFWAWLL